MGNKTSKNKPKANEQAAPPSEEKVLDDSSSSSKSSNYYEEEFVPEPIDPKAKTVKVHLYKLDISGMSLNMSRWSIPPMFDEIFIPNLGVCVNFCEGEVNIIESKHRRNDDLEHKKTKVPTFIPDTKYYKHTETEIPIELYKMVEQVVNLRKQTKKTTKLLEPLKQFICNAPTEQVEYTNPMVVNIQDMDKYLENESGDRKKKNNGRRDSN